MNGSTNVLAIAGDISFFGLRAVTSRTDEERAAEGTGTCVMGRRVHRGVVGKLRMSHVDAQTVCFHTLAPRCHPWDCAFSAGFPQLASGIRVALPIGVEVSLSAQGDS